MPRRNVAKWLKLHVRDAEDGCMRCWIRTLGLLGFTVTLLGCEPDSKLSKLPDSAILSEIKRCDSIRNPSSLKQVICDNHRRECARRKLCSAF